MKKVKMLEKLKAEAIPKKLEKKFTLYLECLALIILFSNKFIKIN